jgi:hypothetical protein
MLRCAATVGAMSQLKPNEQGRIKLSFQDYYCTTLLSEETDPNKLNDQKAALDGAQVYNPEQVEQFVALFLAGDRRSGLLTSTKPAYLRAKHVYLLLGANRL